MLMNSRRAFLRLLGATPVALPVAAKEAAAKMGLASITSAAGALPGDTLPTLHGPVPTASGGDGWLRDALADLTTPTKQAEFRERAALQAGRLDADLAALRSVSPAAAFAIQRERCFVRVAKYERSWVEREMERFRKNNPLF